MRINKVFSKNNIHYYIIRDIKKNGKRTTCVYENIGDYNALKLRAGSENPITWLNNYVKSLNKQNRDNTLHINIKKNPNQLIKKNNNIYFNIGYLFLQKIYYDLKINIICENIVAKHNLNYDLNDILSKLVYSKILSYKNDENIKLSNIFLEKIRFTNKDVELAINILFKEKEYLIIELYKNIINLISDKYIYFYNLLYKNYTLGIYINKDGIPLSYNIDNKKKVNNDKIIIYDDNNKLKYIESYSKDKLKKYISKDSIIKNWHILGSENIINLINIKDLNLYKDKTLYKKINIKENNNIKKVILLYKVTNTNNIINDIKKFTELHIIETNINIDIEEIIKIYNDKLKIKEYFNFLLDVKNIKIMNINLLLSFISFIIYKILETKLNNKYSKKEIISTLKEMKIKKETMDLYIPYYIRTDLTDELHDIFKFRTDYEIINEKELNNICKQTKN